MEPMERAHLKNIIEAALLAAGEPLGMDKLASLFAEDEQPGRAAIVQALEDLRADCAGRSLELVEVGSGYRLQVRAAFAPWVSRLWEERPARYSRALLETLALIAYRQPITRAEIEDIRGVSVSSSIVKTLQEREWIRVVGHRDVPGKPAMYATTRGFLDYFNLKSLDELPPLAELRDIDSIDGELAFAEESEAHASPEMPALDVALAGEDADAGIPSGHPFGSASTATPANAGLVPEAGPEEADSEETGPDEAGLSGTLKAQDEDEAADAASEPCASAPGTVSKPLEMTTASEAETADETVGLAPPARTSVGDEEQDPGDDEDDLAGAHRVTN